MSLDKKKQFIEVTYRILEEEGAQAVKIRRLASELNCTSTVVYRYFDNLDHLIALASMRYFNEYLQDFRNISSDPLIFTDPYSLNLKMWECISEHAFRNIPVYENLFFGKYQNSLGEVIFEYYQLFMDDAKQDFDGYATSVLFNDNIYQRDLVLLRRAAALGIISLQSAEDLSQIECHIFHGIMLKYKDEYRTPGIPAKAKDEFIHLLTDLSEKYKKS